MKSEYAYAWCQDCKCWVPSNKMNYFDNNRVCIWCLEGIKKPQEFIYDPHHEDVQCIYCDSYNTRVIDSHTFMCKECNEIFKIGV